MKLDNNQLKLYAITDRSWLKENERIYDIVDKALDGGATIIQVREKTLDRNLFLKEILELKSLCHKYGVPLIVNDDIALSIEAKADGVHIGQEDLKNNLINLDIPKSMILGISAHNIEEALLAEKKGASYIGVGAIFPTNTKSDAQILNPRILKTIAESIIIPTVAIGGINEKNIHLLSKTSIAGVSMISGIFNNLNIKKATNNLLKIIERTQFK